MSESAFGVEHGEISKKEKEASTGRKVAGTVFGGYHGAVAGKKGHKLRAIGNSAGGTIAGGVIGSALAGPKLGLVGSASGAYMGVQRNQRKGHLKPEYVGKALTTPMSRMSRLTKPAGVGGAAKPAAQANPLLRQVNRLSQGAPKPGMQKPMGSRPMGGMQKPMGIRSNANRLGGTR